MSICAGLQGLYDEHAQALFAFVLNLTRNEADTRDVLQEIFLKVARRPQLLENVRDVRGFLIRLGHNQAVDLMRRRATRQKNYDRFTAESEPVFEASSHADESVFRQALASALGELPPEQRVVVHLKLWEKMTLEAIAEALEIPPNTAASRYRYGLDKLRDRLRLLYEELKSHG